MIKAQQFSGSIPTVGGDIHIAIITRANGFVWISKEEYTFRGHAVRKHHNHD
jgi:exosome complex RNA-binding protein Rrp4